MACRASLAYSFQIRLKKEQEEKADKKRYKAQAHLYTIIKVILAILFSHLKLIYAILVNGLLNLFIIYFQVARDEDLREQIGTDIYFDLVDHDKVRNFRIQKQMPFNQFKVSFFLDLLMR